MNAYFIASVTGWCSFKLESLTMKFYEGREEYEFPVTWNSQRSGLWPRCMSPDSRFCFQLKDLSVNGRDASGCLGYFRTAKVVSMTVQLRGKGEKDMKLIEMFLDDGKHQKEYLPEENLRMARIRYKTRKAPGRLPGDYPRAIRNRFGHIGIFERLTRNKKASYLFETGDIREYPCKDLREMGCRRKCLLKNR